MSDIGSYIKKYRNAKGITQEQLGELVGVTTQAVSKWERGGTPDAELLPQLSEVLEVSIDALFGRGEENIPFILSKSLRHMPREDVFHYAFGICWALQHGLINAPNEPDHFLKTYLDYSKVIYAMPEKYGRIMQDQGMAVARVTPDFRYFFLMEEPEGGLQAQLADMERLRQVFALFADPTLLKIISYLYTRLNTPIATSLISKNVGLSIKEVDRYMDILTENALVKRTAIDAAEGTVYSYMFNLESAVIAMFCFADELAQKTNDEFLWDFGRTKPLFKTTKS